MDRDKYISIRKKISQNHPFFYNSMIHVTVNYLLVAMALIPWLVQEIPWFLKILSPLVFAISMYRSFALFHDGTHNSLHKSKVTNDVLAILVSPLCLLPFDAWKASHLQHHLWSGNVENDPVMGFIKIHPQLSNKFRDFLDLTWKSWLPVLAVIQHFVFWTLSAKSTFGENLKLRPFLSFAFPIVFWVTVIWMIPMTMILGLVIPTLFIYLLGTEVINLPHHLQLNYRYDDSKLPAWQQHQTARSCYYPIWISNYVVLNFNYHIEHHMYPDLPWYKLPDAHQFVSAELKEKYIKEQKFSWIKNSRKLNMAQVLAPDSKSDHGLDTVA